jgi:GT2 family glycosyltransferase
LNPLSDRKEDHGSDLQVSIIIINWKSAEYLKQCLLSLARNTHEINYEVIVVDNASYDGCRDIIEKDFKDVRFLQSDSNLGFGKANNLGVSVAKGEVLLLLNPDTEMHGNSLDRLYTTFRSLESPGIVGCRIINSDGSLQTSCVQSFPTVLNQILDSDFLRALFPNSKQWGITALYLGDAVSKVEAVSGACMMVNSTVYNRIGGFSPEYFMYGEDLDLCYKAIQAGYTNYHVGGVVIVHHGGGSTQHNQSDFSVVVMRESVRLFLAKARGRIYGQSYRFLLGITGTMRLLLLVIISPVWLFQGEMAKWKGSFNKWKAIIRWAFVHDRS